MSREKDLRRSIIEAGYRAVEQLIKVAKEDIIKPDPEDDLSADKLKNAAASKRLAIFDAFEILNKIEAEKATLEEVKDDSPKLDTKQGFAERRAK
jgi:hypothetical protein